MRSSHTWARQLQRGPVRGECIRYAGGDAPGACPRLRAVVGELAFAVTAERSIEADHARRGLR
eukprot:3116294-Alexandrium_andersonii.AAC.1